MQAALRVIAQLLNLGLDAIHGLLNLCPIFFRSQLFPGRHLSVKFDIDAQAISIQSSLIDQFLASSGIVSDGCSRRSVRALRNVLATTSVAASCSLSFE